MFTYFFFFFTYLAHLSFIGDSSYTRWLTHFTNIKDTFLSSCKVYVNNIYVCVWKSVKRERVEYKSNNKSMLNLHVDYFELFRTIESYVWPCLAVRWV